MEEQKNSPDILEQWNTEINPFIQKSKTFCIAIYNCNGKLIYSNPAFRHLIVGDEKETLLNPTFEKLTATKKDDKHIVFDGFLTIGSITQNQSIQSVVYQKNDELLIIGEVEIEELKKLNDTMLQLNREVNNLQRQLIKEKNRILGIAAHDLRNPMGTILGFAQLLSQRVNKISADDMNKFLSVIINSSNFSLNLLNDLLDISKIESGKVQLNYTKINYIDFVKTIIAQN